MDAKILFEEGNYLPAAEAGYPLAMEVVAKYYMQNGEKMKGLSWIKNIKVQQDVPKRKSC